MKDPLEYFKKFGMPVYFWMRQVFHFLGGALVGLGAYGLSFLWPYMWAVAGGILLTVILAKEVFENRSGQVWYKTPIDVAAWFCGFWLMFAMLGAVA